MTDWTCEEHVRVCERLKETELITSITAKAAAALEERLRRLEVRVAAWAAGGALVGSVLVTLAAALLRQWIGG